MCGRYRNKMSWDQLRRLMELAIPDASSAPNMEPNLDIRPTTSQWVIRPTSAGNEATRLRWGLVDRKSTRLNSSHSGESRMPSSA